MTSEEQELLCTTRAEREAKVAKVQRSEWETHAESEGRAKKAKNDENQQRNDFTSRYSVNKNR